MLSKKQLRSYLAYTVHGIQTPLEKPKRKPPQRERRGPERDANYRAWIRTLPCACGCGRGPCDAAHTGTEGEMSMKASDRSCVPLFRECHQEYHQHGKLTFERKYRLIFAQEVKRLNREWRNLRKAAYDRKWRF